MKFLGTIAIARIDGGRGTRFQLQVSKGNGLRFLSIEMTPEQFANALTGVTTRGAAEVNLDRLGIASRTAAEGDLTEPG